MQDTRTPYLKLSNLEKGMYTFVLKVTDASNQSSSDDVNVLVKNRENQPPVAKAGANVTINLPQNWAVLNATASSADLKIHSYLWKQLSGPNVANIDKVNSSLTNATGLTIGKYEFQVTVIDEGKFNSSDKMVVTIVQGLDIYSTFFFCSFCDISGKSFLQDSSFLTFREKYSPSCPRWWRSKDNITHQFHICEWHQFF